MSDLIIYPFILETIALMRPYFEVIRRHDADLARQGERAAASVALNTSEGAYSRGRNKQSRYHTALGSAREAFSCLEVALALGYLDSIDERISMAIDRILGTLTRLAR
jgi:four helix bundle protein